MPVLKTKGLTKKYGKITALDNLNLEIEAGNIYGLLGPNGSGKTTTLGLILGILSANSGSYEWFDGVHGEHHRLRIGAILETPNFYPYLNGMQNLEIIRQIKGGPDTDFEDILKQVHLYDRRFSRFKTYSLGMKQRLAIGATMIGNPDVVIFDEPTNGLDPQGIAEVRSILMNVANSGKTVILASHILDEVEKICSHVAIIKKGKLLASGPVGTILSNDTLMEIYSDDVDQLKSFLSGLSFIKRVEEHKGFLECLLDNSVSVSEVNKLAFEQGIVLTHLVGRNRKLEEAFLTITAQA